MAEYYLKIEGVEGDARRSEHAGEIYVESFSLSTFTDTSAPQENRASSQHGLNISLSTQKASVRLMTASAANEKFKQVVMTMYSHPGAHQQRMRYVFSNARIQSYHIGGSSHSDPVGTDNVTLVFSKFDVEFARMQEDGTFGQAVRGGFDYVAMQSVGDPSKY